MGAPRTRGQTHRTREDRVGARMHEALWLHVRLAAAAQVLGPDVRVCCYGPGAAAAMVVYGGEVCWRRATGRLVRSVGPSRLRCEARGLGWAALPVVGEGWRYDIYMLCA